ncbi:hypothetical protein K1719_010212 [Acacia pycnantha]|nr:hypothetical protein K1719_010212 [Acacia pycnantha]
MTILEICLGNVNRHSVVVSENLRAPELRAQSLEIPPKAEALVAFSSPLADLRGRRISSSCRSEAHRFLPKQAQKRRASSCPLKAKDSSRRVVSSSQAQRFLPSASSNSRSRELVEAHNQLICAKIHPLGSLASGRRLQVEIRVPNKFTGRYGSGLSNPVLLKPPDGKEWKVHLKTHDNEVWFQQGCKEFVGFYSLDEGHLILFKYEGTSRFDVHLFDMSQLEIDYPSSSNKNNLKDDTVETSDKMPPNPKARHKTLLPSFGPDKKMRSLPKSHVVSETNHGQYQGTEFQKSTNAVELKFPMKEPEDDIGVRISSTCLNSEHRRKRALTTLEKIRAINSPSSFKSEYPFFMVIMQPAYVRHKCHLVMATKLAKTHLEKKHGIVQLEARDGRTWPVKYTIPTIKDGWEKFVMENGLKVGQVCIFEMISRMFKVRIFGDQDEGKSRKRIYNLAEDLKVKKEQISRTTMETLSEDQTFVIENVFEHHPDKAAKMGAGIDYVMEYRPAQVMSKDSSSSNSPRRWSPESNQTLPSPWSSRSSTELVSRASGVMPVRNEGVVNCLGMPADNLLGADQCEVQTPSFIADTSSLSRDKVETSVNLFGKGSPHHKNVVGLCEGDVQDRGPMMVKGNSPSDVDKGLNVDTTPFFEAIPRGDNKNHNLGLSPISEVSFTLRNIHLKRPL